MLRWDDGQELVICNEQCHATVNARFLLAQRFWGGTLEVFDMATGKSVLGALSQAVWVDQPKVEYAEARAELVTAYQAGDFASMVEASEKTLRARLDYPGGLFNLALSHVLNENPEAAMVVLWRLLELGADIVFHSLTKYMSGHSDVLGGAIICKAEDHFSSKLEAVQHYVGNVLDPFSCWLTMRGLRTLSLRMTRHCDNAETIASFLAGHHGVEKVFYPGLPGDIGHQIATSQMDRYGAMISFLVDGGAQRAMEVVGRTVLIKRATSLGSTESLLEHRASSEGPDSTTPQNLIRLSVGIEDAGDLVEDLKRALN